MNSGPARPAICHFFAWRAPLGRSPATTLTLSDKKNCCKLEPAGRAQKNRGGNNPPLAARRPGRAAAAIITLSAMAALLADVRHHELDDIPGADVLADTEVVDQAQHHPYVHGA